MSEHHEAACRVVASIKGGPEAFVQQCRRLKQSNDEQVLESICDTVCERVTKKCYVASLASDREKAFDTLDMTTLNELNTECSEFVDSYQQSRSAYFKQQESPVDNLTSKFATASISPVAGVVKKVPRSRDSSRQGTPQPSKAPSVADGDVPDQAARIVTLQRVSELEAELVLKANRVIKLEAELKLKETRMTELAAERDGFVKEADLSLQKGMGKKRAQQRTREVTPLSDADLIELEKGRMTRAAVANEGAKKVKDHNLLHGLPMTVKKNHIGRNRLSKAEARGEAELIEKDAALYLQEVTDGLLEQ
eukprot:gene10499-12417_t